MHGLELSLQILGFNLFCMFYFWNLLRMVDIGFIFSFIYDMHFYLYESNNLKLTY